jgi:GxxExxY protein
LVYHEGTKGTKMDRSSHESMPDRVEVVATAIVDAAIAVHRGLGQGLLESAYEACLCYELSKRHVNFRRQVDLPVHYQQVLIETGYRIDVLADECVVIEIKSVEAIAAIHEAQLLTSPI